MILTDEEIDAVYSRLRGETFEEALRSIDFARAIEAAIIEKMGKPVAAIVKGEAGTMRHPVWKSGIYPDVGCDLYALPEVKK